MESPVFTRPTDGLYQDRQNLDVLINSLSTSILHYHELKRQGLNIHLGKLTAMNPNAILNRGYNITLKLPDSQLITSVDSVEPSDRVMLIMKDGDLKCVVEEKSKKDPKYEVSNQDNNL
jgi:exodeoxyribonuclease VII large subunit